MSQAPPTSEKKSFPIARRVIRFLRKRLREWQVRHQLSFNFYIHLIGIPLALCGVVLLFYEEWYWGVGAIVLGYFLQWLGHRAEGNDVGEWAGIKRLLGLPYVSISPRWQQLAPETVASSASAD